MVSISDTTLSIATTWISSIARLQGAEGSHIRQWTCEYYRHVENV